MRAAKRRLGRRGGQSKKSPLKERAEQCGFGYTLPPEPEFLQLYFDEQELPAEAERFYRHYENLDWKTVTGKPIRNWKVLAADWIFNHRQEQKRQARLNRFQS